MSEERKPGRGWVWLAAVTALAVVYVFLLVPLVFWGIENNYLGESWGAVVVLMWPLYAGLPWWDAWYIGYLELWGVT